MTCNYIENYELKNHTTFKIGGLAQRVFFPETIEQLCELLQTLHNPLILGNCSNVLVSSKGIEQDVILTSKLNKFEVSNNIITAYCFMRLLPAYYLLPLMLFVPLGFLVLCRAAFFSTSHLRISGRALQAVSFHSDCFS